MEFTKNGTPQYEKMSTMITDTTDGYLSNVGGIEYQSGSPAELKNMLQQIAPTNSGRGGSGNANEIGGQLMSILSQLHNILTDITIHDQDESLALERLTNFTGLATKLSEAYSQTDPYYEENFHENIVKICEVIDLQAE